MSNPFSIERTSLKTIGVISGVLIALAGCQSSSPPTPTATIAPPPTPTVTIAPPPTPTTTIALTPTPTMTTVLPTPTGGLRPWIDTHTHPLGIANSCTSQSCANSAVAAMDAAGVRKAIFMPPPAPAGAGDASRESTVVTVTQYRPERLFYGMGGNMLNSLIDKMPDSGVATPAQKTEFQNTFDRLAASYSGAVVWGEMATLHLSYEPVHAFEESPTNSDLMKLLVDLAATSDRAIDLHIDVVTQTMSTPTFFRQASPRNPAQIQANIPALENLLTYNRNARIVLDHVGRDTTGHMSPSLIDRLLAAHPNLYAQIHPTAYPLQSATAILDRAGNVRAEWIALVQKYPDRFVVGSDTFFAGNVRERSLEEMQRFLQQLPGDLAYKIGCVNPLKIYKLSSGC